MQRFEVEGHEPSYLPEGEWKLVFSAKEKDNTAFDALWILLLCEYPHHLLCGICRTLA